MKLRHTYLSILFCVLLLPNLFSQSLYELNYSYETQDGPKKYKAFMMLNDDGTGMVRIAFTDLQSGHKNIVEYVVDEFFDQDDISIATQVAYVTSEPVQILGDISYPPDHFIMVKNEETGYFEPSYVLSIDEETKEEEQGNFEDVRLLNENDLTEDFMRTFFVESDETFQNLFVNEVKPITVEQKSTKLHLILVANTLDKKIGRTCVIDKENVLSLFEEITGFLGIGYSTQVIEGKDFNRKNVDAAISKVKPGENDIVVFYYTGHGYNPGENGKKFPNLDLRERVSDDIGGLNTLNIEDIFQLIRSKNARLNLVLSDCCNNDIFASNSIVADGVSLRTSSIGWNKNFCADLFLKKKESILMTGASKGQLSAGNVADGGIFTYNLRENIEKSVGKLAPVNNVNWQSIVVHTQNQTKIRANNSKCRMPDESVQPCSQLPVYEVK